LGISIIYFIFEEKFATLGLITLSFSDPFASIFGIYLKICYDIKILGILIKSRVIMQGKTLSGSIGAGIANSIFSFIIV